MKNQFDFRDRATQTFYMRPKVSSKTSANFLKICLRAVFSCLFNQYNYIEFIIIQISRYNQDSKFDFVHHTCLDFIKSINIVQDKETITEDSPSEAFSGMVTQWTIYDAYVEDFEAMVSEIFIGIRISSL